VEHLGLAQGESRDYDGYGALRRGHAETVEIRCASPELL